MPVNYLEPVGFQPVAQFLYIFKIATKQQSHGQLQMFGCKPIKIIRCNVISIVASLLSMVISMTEILESLSSWCRACDTVSVLREMMRWLPKCSLQCRNSTILLAGGNILSPSHCMLLFIDLSSAL